MSHQDVPRVLLALAASSETLRERLDSLRKEWEPETPPPTVALGALGTALVRAVDRTTDDELSQVASVVESLLTGASDAEKDAVATGFLEAVLSGADVKSGATRFIAKLGPLARQYCQDWDAFCGVRTPGLRDKR